MKPGRPVVTDLAVRVCVMSSLRELPHFRHASLSPMIIRRSGIRLNEPRSDSMNALSVRLPGREKLRMTQRRKIQRSRPVAQTNGLQASKRRWRLFQSSQDGFAVVGLSRRRCDRLSLIAYGSGGTILMRLKGRQIGTLRTIIIGGGNAARLSLRQSTCPADLKRLMMRSRLRSG